jgi:hypothetical protein
VRIRIRKINSILVDCPHRSYKLHLCFSPHPLTRHRRTKSPQGDFVEIDRRPDEIRHSESCNRVQDERERTDELVQYL